MLEVLLAWPLVADSLDTGVDEEISVEDSLSVSLVVGTELPDDAVL